MENRELYLKNIGNNIRAIRLEKKLEIKQVAAKLGISIQAYGKIENGKTDLNISRLFEIANLLQVEFSQILNIVGDTLHYNSQNNSGGYHVQKVGVLNTTDDTIVHLIKDIMQDSMHKILSAFEKNKK
jgi:transcriptional regulator with XRE-family HTH domain